MILACDPAVDGVSEEDAADAREAVAAAKAAAEKEAEAKKAAEEAKKAARKNGGKPTAARAEDAAKDGAAKTEKDAEAEKETDAEKEEAKEEKKKEASKPTRSSKRGQKTDEEEEGDDKEEEDKAKDAKDAKDAKEAKEEKEEKEEEEGEKAAAAAEKAEETKEAGSEKAAAEAARATAAAVAAAALNAPVPPALRSLVSELLPRLTHCCFQKNWQSVVGGVAGIDALSRVLPISALRAHLARILQALLRALLSLPPHAVKEVGAATETLHRVLEAATPAGTPVRGEDAPPGLETAIRVLTEELFSTTSSLTVRPVVEAAVAGLAERSGLPVGKVLDVKAAHVGGLLSRPLHARQVRVQTQVVHVLNFCLSAEPEPLIKIHASFVGVLQVALAPAENDDPSAAAAAAAQARRRTRPGPRTTSTRCAWRAFAHVQRDGVPRAPPAPASSAAGGGAGTTSSRSSGRGSSRCFKSSPAARPRWWTSPRRV